MKIKFYSDDNLPLYKLLKFSVLTIIVRLAFEKDGKYYPQIFLGYCLYEKDEDPAYTIDSVNPLYLNVYTLDGFIEEKDGSKYLNVALTDYNNNVLKKYSEVWKGIKNQIVKINNGLGGEYDKDYMKIKFDSDDNLPLNKVMRFYDLTVIIKSIFEKGDKYYPQFFLDDCLYDEVLSEEHMKYDYKC